MTSGASNGHIDDLNERYARRIYKKSEKQRGPLQTLMRRTGMTAIMVLDELYDIPFEKLEVSLYFISSDLNVKTLTRKYESMLELASVSADKFVDSLHRELNALSVFIKSNGLIPELFEMISLCYKLRYTYGKTDTQTVHIMNAYQDITLQTLEYLRPSKFDFKSAVCGYSTDGDILTVPEYYLTL